MKPIAIALLIIITALIITAVTGCITVTTVSDDDDGAYVAPDFDWRPLSRIGIVRAQFHGFPCFDPPFRALPPTDLLDRLERHLAQNAANRGGRVEIISFETLDNIDRQQQEALRAMPKDTVAEMKFADRDPNLPGRLVRSNDLSFCSPDLRGWDMSGRTMLPGDAAVFAGYADALGLDAMVLVDHIFRHTQAAGLFTRDSASVSLTVSLLARDGRLLWRASATAEGHLRSESISALANVAPSLGKTEAAAAERLVALLPPPHP